MEFDKKAITVRAAIAAGVLSFGAGLYFAGDLGDLPRKLGPDAARAKETDSAKPSALPAGTIELSEKQMASVKVDAAAQRLFPTEKASVGSIDFNEDMETQVFTPYQGRIVGLFGKIGDEVTKGQTLFTIDSPDLVQASSTLIAAAGVLELTARNLVRLTKLYETRAVAQKDLEQAVSDHQTAEGALRAARDAVRIFGKTDAEMDKMVAEHRVDPTLVVPSPISGLITARSAAPGLLVQPGAAPAPFTVADVSTMWMLANVAESDSPAFRVSQEVKVKILAYPGRVFEGKITTIGAIVDPNSHRVLVRSEIDDPKHELRSGMIANFVIRTGDAVRSTAVPLEGVVREGDGTQTVWVSAGGGRFVKRTVKIGLQADGFRQILEGLQPGERVVTDNAVFLSNMLVIGQTGG
jgi:cobalt-zinc-cadmium efflux system membrane fusion protein